MLHITVLILQLTSTVCVQQRAGIVYTGTGSSLVLIDTCTNQTKFAFAQSATRQVQLYTGQQVASYLAS